MEVTKRNEVPVLFYENTRHSILTGIVKWILVCINTDSIDEWSDSVCVQTIITKYSSVCLSLKTMTYTL